MLGGWFLPDGNCDFRRFDMYGFFQSGVGSDCRLSAPLLVPDGVRLTSMSCTVLDDTSAIEIEVDLFRSEIALPGVSTGGVFTTNTSVDSSDFQTLSAPAGGGHVVQPGWAYRLSVDFGPGTPPGSGELRFYGCTIGYAPPD